MSYTCWHNWPKHVSLCLAQKAGINVLSSPGTRSCAAFSHLPLAEQGGGWVEKAERRRSVEGCPSQQRKLSHRTGACHTKPLKESWKSPKTKTSLVVQWLRICPPVQGTWVRALVREDPTCCGATKPVRHNYWACALEPVSHNYWARVPQLLKPTHLEPVLRNKRSHHNEKPAHCNKK